MNSLETIMLLRRIQRQCYRHAHHRGTRWLIRPFYGALFQYPYYDGNAYHGVYESFAEAAAAAPASRPSTYDVAEAGNLYRSRMNQITPSDYPIVFWLSRLFDTHNARCIGDLGGHIGVNYYGFQRCLDYPVDLSWRIHDVPSVMAAGRTWADSNDPRKQLQFVDSRADLDGLDVLISNGALQYLDYSLPELIDQLSKPPAHVFIGLTPMHPSKNYFTLQNLGIAICPYRVMQRSWLMDQMQQRGYQLRDHWESYERQLRIPYHHDHDIDCYHGMYFCRE